MLPCSTRSSTPSWKRPRARRCARANGNGRQTRFWRWRRIGQPACGKAGNWRRCGKRSYPLAYWETLGRLNEEEARDLSTTGTISPESKRLRLELTEMESTAGVGVSVMLAENFRTRNSLIHFQQGLGESDLLLSFYLGKRESYLWAVTQSSIELHRLPAESEIREDVRRFREAILRPGQPAGERLGADLYQRLFGSLDPADAAKTSWLLSLDGALFDLPFAALVSGYENGQPVYAAGTPFHARDSRGFVP